MRDPMACDPRYLEAAACFADAARATAMKYFRQNPGITRKPDASLVTEADLAVETHLRGMISAAFPTHDIIGEEFEALGTSSALQWVVDPIDGTSRFAAAHPQFAVLISLLFEGSPILGLLDAPATDERWIGARGHPTMFFDKEGGHLARVRECASLGDATVFLGGGMMRLQDPMAVWNALPGKNRLMEGEAYGYGLLASGYADIVTDCGMKIWDYLPLVPIVEGAGGVITDWSGRGLLREQNVNIIATGSSELHRVSIARLEGLV
ncbi:histidinol phosphate phosphatase [Ancylobacter sp. A5.8]|uniref:inositol monophosphatase family protein n=1 Tax=Ancylobacter gelatini TaxID=2919920 RepID=UPI001F4E30E6|nr:inositol monophosphatase family protein [Ancylobacter gelatini]MCJ8142326.1 histidinol phosphate phosphatase [Ancylobacter gelatini]